MDTARSDNDMKPTKTVMTTDNKKADAVVTDAPALSSRVCDLRVRWRPTTAIPDFFIVCNFCNLYNYKSTD